MSLFRRSRFTSTAPAKRRGTVKKSRTWTCEFVCLSNKDATKTPTGEEKLALKRAGMGSKKIQFCIEDTEEMIHQKILSNEGFSKLNESGGFELLRCQSNCRNLEVISGKWTPENLRENIGCQAKIYIRPIQKSLSLESHSLLSNETEIKEKCIHCKVEFLVTELRDHLKECNPSSNTPSIENHDNKVSNPENAENVEETQSGEPDEHHSVANSDNFSDDDLPDLYTHRAANRLDDATSVGQSGDLLHQIINTCIEFCSENKVSDPVDILRYLQDKIVYGRDLDLATDSSTIEGETNFIIVNRFNLLESALEEISGLTDLRLTLEVQFYDEAAVDLGGPRKEFFSMILREIKDKYFDPIKEWSKDYETIGKIFALSILQNGPLPRILSPDLIEELFESNTPRQIIKDLRSGLDSLGLYKLVRGIPTLVHLFTPKPHTPITLKMLTNLLKPEFAPEGSNRRKRENEVYSKFIKYLREAASGRRGDVNLAKVMKFTTSMEEEPVLGFMMPPSLHFSERRSYLPTGNTCINRLTLTVPEVGGELPKDEFLFNLFDYAFSNTYYGLQ